MLDRYALIFSEALTALRQAENIYRSHPPRPSVPMLKGSAANPFKIDPDPEPPDLDWTNIRKNITQAALTLTRQAVEAAGLDIEAQVARVERRAKMDSADMKSDLANLADRIRDELQKEWFVHVPRVDVELYGHADLFGPDVAAKFGMGEDIEAAGNCLAVGQPTACVFHLMRIMERGVHILGKALRVKFDPGKQSWFEICNSASKAATNRPAKTPKQRKRNAALGAAVAHLQTVRLAWRNEVMHPKQTYTADEAREVLLATRSFVADLAELVG